MKKVLALVLTLAMLVTLFPAALAADCTKALCFTWGWGAQRAENTSEAMVATWQGGETNALRSSFLVYDITDSIDDDCAATLDFSINSATLNNGDFQSPTVAVVLVNGDAVKDAYRKGGSECESVLAVQKEQGLFIGTYKISAAPAENALSGIDITEYFQKNKSVKSLGIYLTNLASDGFECTDGIASAMSDFTVKTNVSKTLTVTLIDENENVIGEKVIRGADGEIVDLWKQVPRQYYLHGVKYTLRDISADEGVIGETAAISASYAAVVSDALLYPCERCGYSGNVLGEDLFVASNGDGSAEGSAQSAAAIDGISYSGDCFTMGSSRAGAMEFMLDGDIDINSIGDAVLNFYVKSVHENLQDAWIRLGVYATDNSLISSYSLGNMDDGSFAAKNGDYSKDAVSFSNETISAASMEWKSVSVREFLIDALEKNALKNTPSSAVRLVLRLQVPTAGIYIAPDGSYAPYISITRAENDLLLHYDFSDALSGKVRDITGNGFDGTLLDEAKLQNGALVLNGNGGVLIDNEDFRNKLSSYTIMSFVTLDGEALTNSRIYDFGANENNSGFLRVKDFAVGMKYDGGVTTLAAQNAGSITPFSQNGKRYHVAVTYSATLNETTVYVNGQRVITTTDITHSLCDFSSASPRGNFIGRSNWHGTAVSADNPDIRASYEDFRVYTSALGQRAVRNIYNPLFESEFSDALGSISDKIAPYEEGAISDKLPLESSVTTKSGDVLSVVWHTSKPDVIDSAGNVFQGINEEVCELYAEVSLDDYSVETRRFSITAARITGAQLGSALICGYDFDEVGTAVLNSGSASDATATSKSVQLNGRANIGEDAVIKLPDNINSGVGEYTIAMWVRADDLSRDGQRLYDFGMENGTAPANYYAFTRLNTDGTLSVGMNNGGATQLMTSSGALNEGEWTHVAIVYNAKTKGTYIYINGVLDTYGTSITYTMDKAMYNGASTSNYIGRSQWYKTQSADNPDFVGKIDSFKFYNAPFSASVIGYISESGYDSPPVEIVSATLIEGMDRAALSVDSHGFDGEADLIALIYDGEILEKLSTQRLQITEGSQSIAFTLPEGGGAISAANLHFMLWSSTASMQPLDSKHAVNKSHSFNFNYERPDNHLLSNSFTLKAYGTDNYLVKDSSLKLAAYDGGSQFLWNAPYEGDNAEGYYAFKHTDGTYIALDSGSIKTNKINNWRFIQIAPEKVGGARNVYALRQRSSGKYFASDGKNVTASGSGDDENAWWVLDVREYDTLSRAFMSDGFFLLSANQRSRIYGVTSQAMWQSSNRRKKLLEYMGGSYFSKSAQEQADLLAKIFSYVPSNQINRAVTAASTATSSPYSLSEITGAANYRGKDGEDLWAYKGVLTLYNNAEKTDVQQTVTIFGRNANVIKKIADGFSHIPYQFRKYIKTIKDYYHTANQFNCGASEMYVRTSFEVSADSFAMTASHEVGHSLSASWGYVHDAGRYINALNGDLNRVSGYGNSNRAEDFAEFTQFAISCSGDKELLRSLEIMFPGRYSVLRSVLCEMNGGSSILD